MIARSSSMRYTAASSAGASPTSRFSESTGTKPLSSSSRRAAEYFAAQPPHAARSVSLTLPMSVLKESSSLSGRDSRVRESSRVERSLIRCDSRRENDNGGQGRRCRFRGEEKPVHAASCCGSLCDSTLSRRSLLDRNVHEVAPLRPRAVVVADVLVAEQLAQHEPRVRAALADAAVRGHRQVGADALRAVELAQLLRRLERAVVPDGLGPRDRLGGRDVPAALR